MGDEAPDDGEVDRVIYGETYHVSLIWPARMSTARRILGLPWRIVALTRLGWKFRKL